MVEMGNRTGDETARVSKRRGGGGEGGGSGGDGRNGGGGGGGEGEGEGVVAPETN